MIAIERKAETDRQRERDKERDRQIKSGAFFHQRRPLGRRAPSGVRTGVSPWLAMASTLAHPFAPLMKKRDRQRQTGNDRQRQREKETERQRTERQRRLRISKHEFPVGAAFALTPPTSDIACVRKASSALRGWYSCDVKGRHERRYDGARVVPRCWNLFRGSNPKQFARSMDACCFRNS